ncbi:hypothetical protein [Tenacibaculum sp. SG-28]|uniref:hypothetical protein n=1 Tax=Tenacibaculum sp. SG-28 TaxID=754426 RepID=UPI000CF4B593|nr:hypothetical protein [Tenacibaculum sp. SG-28]PQJ19910.1 hypothetical protein BSU00_11355 [Tenacibaculum sp. SG-28]
MKKTVYLLIASIGFISCDLISLKTKRNREEKPVAIVYNKHLYKKDIAALMPKEISEQDSLILVKGLIYSWAKQQIFLSKAEENISEVNSLEIEKLVNDYKSSLYVNGYKEKLIKQRLDTIVSDQEIAEYYIRNKENFKLNEDLLQFAYVNFAPDHLDRDQIVKDFSAANPKNIEDLDKFLLSFKSYRLQDSSWVNLNYLKEKIPPFRSETKEKLLKISKLIQKEDSLGVYLVAIKNILKKNEIAPLSNVSWRIKQIILHKRKLELIREIEKTLINDAIKNNNFKEY